jgi:hypothetical protein
MPKPKPALVTHDMARAGAAVFPRSSYVDRESELAIAIYRAMAPETRPVPSRPMVRAGAAVLEDSPFNGPEEMATAVYQAMKAAADAPVDRTKPPRPPSRRSNKPGR